MAKILGTSIGKTSSIIFLVLVVFISLALSNVSFLVSKSVAGPPLRLEGMKEGIVISGQGVGFGQETQTNVKHDKGYACSSNSECNSNKCGKNYKCA